MDVEKLALMQLLWKTVWQLLKKLNIELLFDPAIPLLCKIYLLFLLPFFHYHLPSWVKLYFWVYTLKN